LGEKYNGITLFELGAIVNNLVIEDYLELVSDDNRETMYHLIRPKGMSAITSAYFLQQLESRQRDLLQARLADSQMKFSKWYLRLTALTIIFIATSALLQYRDRTAQRVQELQQVMQEQSKNLKDIRISLQAINSSIGKLKMDSLSVRLKK